MMLLIFMGIFILFVIYKWVNMRPLNYPPGPPCLPLVGNAPFVPFKDMHFTMEKWRYEYGPIVGLLLGPLKAIALCDPSAILTALKREEFLGRPLFETDKQRMFGKKLGIFFNDGPGWIEQRLFTIRNLKDLGFGRMSMENEILNEIIDLLNEISSKTVQVNGLFALSTVNTLWRLMAGTRYHRCDPELSQLLFGLQVAFRGTSPFGAILSNMMPFLSHIAPKLLNGEYYRVNKKLQTFIRKTIKDHEASLDEKCPRDFIDLYLLQMKKNGNEEHTYFSEEGLIVVCMDLFTAGAESVSNTLGFVMLYLVLYPDIQEKMQSLIDEHIGTERSPSLQDKISLPFVEAFLMEVQRINTIAPLNVPRRVLEDTELNGYYIPKDTFVLSSLWCLLHDKDHWKDPENFRPSRFLDEHGNLINDKWFIPFSFGKRACLGDLLTRNMLFLFLTCILHKFTIVLPPGSPEPSTLAMAGLTTSPQPFDVTFVPR